MAERSLFMNAVIGAAVTVVLTFIPFSSVLGGGVAGYLEGGGLRGGFRAGALSGLLATVPMLIVFAFIGSIVAFGMLGMAGPRMLAFGAAFVAFVFLFSLVYLVGFSALGGAVGAAIRDDRAIAPEDGG